MQLQDAVLPPSPTPGTRLCPHVASNWCQHPQGNELTPPREWRGGPCPGWGQQGRAAGAGDPWGWGGAVPERAPTERCKYRYSWEMQRAKLGTPQYATPWGLSRHRRLADPERDTRGRGGGSRPAQEPRPHHPPPPGLLQLPQWGNWLGTTLPVPLTRGVGGTLVVDDVPGGGFLPGHQHDVLVLAHLVVGWGARRGRSGAARAPGEGAGGCPVPGHFFSLQVFTSSPVPSQG